MMRALLPISFLFLLTACVSTGRYQQHHDSTPTRLPTLAELQDPIPRIEPPSKGGNRDYQVRGKFYQVLKSADNFKQRGIASWYGNKFHGHLTSNGEIYNMYSMSAAHKSLPLPTYVKVTNEENGKSVIVRVNDRGPFHQNRIIDLSYSAAYKLDMLHSGTAKVTIEAITANNIARYSQTSSQSKDKTSTKLSPQPAPKQALVIQVFATKNQELARSTANGLANLYQVSSNFHHQDGIFKVTLGPIENEAEAIELLSNLKQNGYPNAYKKWINTKMLSPAS